MSIHQLIATSGKGGGATPMMDFYFDTSRTLGNNQWAGQYNALYDPFDSNYYISLTGQDGEPGCETAHTFGDGTTGKVATFDGNQAWAVNYLNTNNKKYFSDAYGTGKANLTVDLWFYPTNNNCVILSETDRPTCHNPAYHYAMLETDGNNNLWARVWGSSSFNTNTTINLNQWNHVQYQYNDSGPFISISVNGTNVYSGRCNVKEGPVKYGSAKNQCFVFAGPEQTHTNAGNQFQGKLGYMRVSNYLAPSSYYHTAGKYLGTNILGVPHRGLQFWSEPSLYNSVGLNYIIPHGNKEYLADIGPYNAHAEFKGSGSGSNGAYYWMRYGGYVESTPKDSHGFFTFTGSNGDATSGFWAFIPNDGQQYGLMGFPSNQLQSFILTGDRLWYQNLANTYGFIQDGLVVTRGTWARYDFVENTTNVKMYVNGSVVKTINTNGAIWYEASNPVFQINACQGNQIGYGINYGGAQFWNVALTDQEISDHYNSTKSIYGL